MKTESMEKLALSLRSTLPLVLLTALLAGIAYFTHDSPEQQLYERRVAEWCVGHEGRGVCPMR